MQGDGSVSRGQLGLASEESEQEPCQHEEVEACCGGTEAPLGGKASSTDTTSQTRGPGS